MIETGEGRKEEKKEKRRAGKGWSSLPLLLRTDDDKDAFWLAQVHFSTGNYTRAQVFLSRHDLIARNASCKYLAAHCLIKQHKYDEALAMLGEKNPTHLLRRLNNSRRKLQHPNGVSRSSSKSRTGPGAAAKAAREGSNSNSNSTSSGGGSNKRGGRLEKGSEGHGNYGRDDGDDASVDIKFEAAMCYLRGICYAKQNAFDRAKECYKDAVRIDVQCFEAFDQLMRNSLMSPDEEWALIESLDFDSITVGDDRSASQEAAEFTKMLYTTRLPKYKNPSAFDAATETLSTHYNLASNPDLLLARAELLYTHCRFSEALLLTQTILAADKHNFNVYPLHLACLHELSRKNELFLTAHDLADHHPEEPTTWLAVGVYYLTIGRIADARRFFSKASMMDPHFGPAWIGFAHTFAAEGEHDQAISAYSTAARLFQGTHLPQLFLGMQNLQLNHVTLADEYLKTAYALCKTDPLLLNEMGVVFYHQDQLKAAADTFTAALALAESIGSEPRAWTATRANLAHTYRRMGMSAPALAEFDEVLRQGGRDAGVFCAKGLVLLELGRTFEAVQTLHEALAIMPQDPIATDLLAKALEEHSLAEVVQVITSEERLSGSIDGGVSSAAGGAGSGAGDGYIPPNASFASSATAGVEEEFENFLRVKKKEAMDRQRNLGAGGSRRQGANNAAASASGKGAGSGNDSGRSRGGRMAKAAARAADAVRRSTRRTRSTEEQASRLEASGGEEREEDDYDNHIIDDSNGVGGGGR